MAGSVDKIKEFFGLQPVEDYHQEGYYSDDRYEYDRGDRERRSDSYYDREDNYRRSSYDDSPRYYSSSREPVAPEPEPAPEPVVERITLTSFLEARKIGEAAGRGDIVVYDISALEKAEAQRVVDFASGIQVAMGSQTKKLSARVFVLVPPGITLDSAQLESLKKYGTL